MPSLALTAVVLALTGAQPLKLAAPGLRAVGIEEKKVAVFSDYLAQQLSLYGIRVTTEAEVQALLGLERQRQLLGCTDDSASCMAELAGALGVDGLITGNVARIDKGYVLTLKIIRAGDGAPMGSYSGRVADESAALDWLAQTAHEFANSVAPKTGAPSTGVHLRGKSWIPAAGAAVLLGVGLGLFIQTKLLAGTLKNGDGADPSQLNQTLSGAQTRQDLGVALLGVGVAALAVAVIFFITGNEPSSAIALLGPTPGVAVAPMTWWLP
jgi:hypothetical protein